ncbi:MAG: hypothetical protein E6Q83_13320 [Thiothrix sp.]|nr:MAG: hypothetical protein E6Q83_13320 [Thiothrix sp.]
MYGYQKTLLLVVMSWGLQACEPKQKPVVQAPNVLNAEQQAQLEQSMQQALILQQLQLQQQIQIQTMQTVQAYTNQIDQQLKFFSATQACAIAGNCRVETRVLSGQ